MERVRDIDTLTRLEVAHSLDQPPIVRADKKVIDEFRMLLARDDLESDDSKIKQKHEQLGF